jgi:hypothetical protein
MRFHSSLVAVALAACSGNVSDAIIATPFDALTIDTALQLGASPSFADERGGGIFIDLSGRAVRVRADGTQAFLESHPSNPVAPGQATAVFALGPSSALVATETGLFVAESGWLIAPPWQDLLPADGLVATAVGDNGVGWLAHTTGLFRLDSGALTELKVNGQSVLGLTAMGVAPSKSGNSGVWFAQGEVISSAAQTSTLDFLIQDSGLTKRELAGGVIAMAGLEASAAGPGELWAITPKALFQFTPLGWHTYTLGRAPKQLLSAGRFAWLQSGDTLFRYDADAKTWGQVRPMASVPTLLAVDAAGAAWVRTDESTSSVSPAAPIRIDGLFQNAKVYDAELVVQSRFATSAKVTSLSWSFDALGQQPVTLTDGQPGLGPQSNVTFYSLGGLESSGVPKSVSFAALGDGLHTLNLTALVDGSVSTRAVSFELHASANAVLSWERDIKPIAEARCSKCHTTGTMPELASFTQWQTNSAAIVNAVRDRRMPADGPLDPGGIQAIARWVNAGTLP